MKAPDFVPQPGCVHEDSCRREWKLAGECRHDWDATELHLGGPTVTIMPSLMVERVEPIRQEHVDLVLTFEDPLFVDEPMLLTLDVQDVERLIDGLQEALKSLPRVRTA